MAEIALDELLRTLADNGVGIAADGDRLRVRAPEGVLTEAMSEAIRQHKSALVAAFSERVSPIRLAEPIDGCPILFCVHGAGGNALFLRHWIDHFEGEGLYAIESPGTNGQTRLPRSLADLVDLYLAEMRAAQSAGPYLIAGYSAGGVIALEMGRRLRAEGEHVPLVVLLDTFHPSIEMRTHSSRERIHKIVKMPATFTQNLYRTKVLDVRAYKEYSEGVQAHLAAGTRLPIELREQYMEDHLTSLMAEALVEPYDGPVALIVAASVNDILDHAGPLRGWEEVLSDLRLEEVPCDHHQLVDAPFAHLVVAAIRRQIRGAAV